jgi:hypothetical protein
MSGRTQLNEQVRTKDGTVTTIMELHRQGLISWDKVENFAVPKRNGERKTRTAYFATMPDGGCWEISMIAYQSRTAGKVTL